MAAGLWPHTAGSVSDRHIMPIMPGKELIQREWAKHGTCSGLSLEDYFGVLLLLR